MVKPDPSLLVDVVAPRVLEAMNTASEMLKRAGVRHVVVGGLAVGANGFPRATKDVDFLVGDEAFQQHAGGVVTLNPAVPFQVNGVAVDLLSAEASESFLGRGPGSGARLDDRRPAPDLPEAEVTAPQGPRRRC